MVDSLVRGIKSKDKINELASKVSTLESLQVVSIADLQGLTGVEGQQVSVASYHGLDDLSGGGTFVWGTGRHNGGTFIDPSRAFPSDWDDQAQLEAWFADSGNDVVGWARRVSYVVNAAWFGAKEGVSDSYRSVQKALDTHPEVEVSKGYVTNTMVVIGERKVLRILANAYLMRTDVNNHDPVVWLAKNQASLIGSSFSSSSIYTSARSPKGIVRIGHKDMTESHDNVNYCSLSGLSIVGKQIYGQGSGEPDIAVYCPNPQFGGLTSYFHTITDIKMQYANYGLVLDGYANGNIIRGLQGIHLGNAVTGQGAMIWLNGALDNTIQGAFFHTSPDSIMLKLTNYDNSINGGVQHNLYANTMTGLVAEQGGANARGVWTDVSGSMQYIEMRHNIAGGNVFTANWRASGRFIGLGADPTRVTVADDRGADYLMLRGTTDGRALFGDAAEIGYELPVSKNQFVGEIRQDQAVTKIFPGTDGTFDININQRYTLSGAVHFSSAFKIFINGATAGGAIVASEYVVVMGGINTWNLVSATKIWGNDVTITETSATSRETLINVNAGVGVRFAAKVELISHNSGYFQ